MSHFTHATCPTCGWSVLLPPLELAAMCGCRLCGGPLQAEDSKFQWHGHIRMIPMRGGKTKDAPRPARSGRWSR